MKKLLIFTTMLCLSLSVTQANANSPIFMGKFKSFFSGDSKKSNTATKPVSLKTKNTPKASSNSKASHSSVNDRFKKAAAARKTVLSKRREESKRMHETMRAEHAMERLQDQQLAQNGGIGNQYGRPVARTQSTTANQPKQRIIVHKKQEETKKSGFPVPIFKNFR